MTSREPAWIPQLFPGREAFPRAGSEAGSAEGPPGAARARHGDGAALVPAGPRTAAGTAPGPGTAPGVGHRHRPAQGTGGREGLPAAPRVPQTGLQLPHHCSLSLLCV